MRMPANYRFGAKIFGDKMLVHRAHVCTQAFAEPVHGLLHMLAYMNSAHVHICIHTAQKQNCCQHVNAKNAP